MTTDHIQCTRFVFGAKSSPTCANYALRTCADDNAENYPHIKKLVYENFYMDEFFEITEDINTAVKIIEEHRHVVQQESFNLTKWMTSDHILQKIPEEHKSITAEEIKDPKSSSEFTEYDGE